MNPDRDNLTAEIGKALVVFAAILANPKPVSTDLVRGWVMVLESAGIRPEEISPGTARVLATATYFPTPGVFLEAVRPEDDASAAEELAWQRTLDIVRAIGGYGSLCIADLAGDGTALWAIERMGWPRLCQELGDENRSILRAEFVRLYRAGRSGRMTCEYVAGRAELENCARGRELTKGELVGRPDWTEMPGRRPALPAPGLARLSETLPGAQCAWG